MFLDLNDQAGDNQVEIHRLGNCGCRQGLYFLWEIEKLDLNQALILN